MYCIVTGSLKVENVSLQKQSSNPWALAMLLQNIRF